MNWWKKIFGADTDREPVDYYREGLDLLRAGKYHEAVTSLRLALRDRPGDVAALQQIAIAFTRIGMTEEAVKTYRKVLELDPAESGAHYGLAFLLLRDGREEDAVQHLRSFLASPPAVPEAEAHVAHARETLAQIATGTTDGGG